MLFSSGGESSMNYVSVRCFRSASGTPPLRQLQYACARLIRAESRHSWHLLSQNLV